jgi:hypothetical protein
MAEPLCLCSHNVGRPLGRAVVCLPSQDDRAVVTCQDNGLVAVDVTRCRDDVYAGGYLGLAIQQLVLRPREVDEVREGVVRLVRGFQLTALAVDRPPDEGRVAADVIEVQVTVHDQVNVARREPHLGKGRVNRRAAWSIPGLGVRVSLAHARVEKQHTHGRSSNVSMDRFDTRCPGLRLGGRPDECPQPDASHVVDAHAVTLAIIQRRHSPSHAAMRRVIPPRVGLACSESEFGAWVSGWRGAAGTLTTGSDATGYVVGVAGEAVLVGDRLWGMRWLYVASGAVTLASVVYVAFAVGKGWDWGLLWWGLLNGALPVVAFNVAFARLSRRTEDAVRWHRRRVLYSGMWLWAGLETGIMATAFEKVWIDLGFTAYIVLCGVAGPVLIALKRRSMPA